MQFFDVSFHNWPAAAEMQLVRNCLQTSCTTTANPRAVPSFEVQSLIYLLALRTSVAAAGVKMEDSH